MIQPLQLAGPSAWGALAVPTAGLAILIGEGTGLDGTCRNAVGHVSEVSGPIEWRER